jgi:hypothetical protein
MTERQFRTSQRVIYVGDQHKCLWGVRLTVRRWQGGQLCCFFPEPDRPGGFGITTWLWPEDLIPEEVAA